MSRRDSGSEPSTVAQEAPKALLSLPGVRVTVVEGSDNGRTITAQRGVVRVGTARDNDLVLTDDAVSRRHLEIRLHQDAVRVRDLGSTNGTSVDGVRIVDAFLSGASIIRLGSTALRVAPVDEPVTVALSRSERFGGLLGQSTAMRELFAILERVAPTEATVLLEGETGTGKEVAAEAIHAHSPRAEGPFVPVDCGAIPASLIESELFGHVRGAFTGAIADRRGLFEEADGGTLFLDEIGELPLELQPKLLRALEKREIRRVGAPSSQPIDVRVVAATHRDLAVEVNRSRFREDLFFRLAVVRVRIPPLRARPEDIPMLVRHLVGCIAPDRRGQADALAKSLAGKAYPGNVRELRNAVERALALAAPEPVAEQSAAGSPDWAALLTLPYKDGLERLTERYERSYVTRALRLSGGSVSGAARLAGLSRRYVQTLMSKHGLRSLRGEDD